MNTVRALLLTPLALTLAACGTALVEDAGGGSARTEDAVTGVRWAVDGVTVDGAAVKARGTPYLEFAAEGRAGGHDGCNHFGAVTAVEGDKITIKPRERTAMACPGGVDAWGKTLWRTLKGELTAEVAGDRLKLTRENGDHIDLTADPAAPLRGTDWTVNGRIDGEARSSLPEGAQARVVFGEKGAVRGSYGCNDFTGDAEVLVGSGSGTGTGTGTGTVAGEGRIAFGDLRGTLRACAGPEGRLERELRSFLKGTVRYEIRHRTLTLLADEGTGFTAVAR